MKQSYKQLYIDILNCDKCFGESTERDSVLIAGPLVCEGRQGLLLESEPRTHLRPG